MSTLRGEDQRCHLVPGLGLVVHVDPRLDEEHHDLQVALTASYVEGGHPVTAYAAITFWHLSEIRGENLWLACME